MKRARFTEEQIIGILRENEAGAKAGELARKHGVSEGTIYAWKAKFGGMSVSDAQRLRALEDENGKLKRLLADAMLDETARFSSWVLREGDGTLETLFTAEFTITDDPGLLALYGVTLPEGHQPGDPVPLPEGQRAGLLTHASLLASHSHANQTSPIHRGVLVRQNLFCHMLPPPPPDVDDVPPDPDPNATTRERFDQHTSDPSCAGCHNLIDPVGFGFENYDGIGAFRTMEGDLPVDASGELLATDVDGPFDGVVELAAQLVESQTVRQCVSRQWFRFALGRSETIEDTCTMDRLYESFESSGHDVRVLLRELVLSDAFRYRRSPAGEGT